MDKINLREKLASFSDHFSPKIVAELNGQHVKLAKFAGEFVWHHHDHEDELFMVVKGRFRMEFRDHDVWLEEGEILVVPRGVEHRPVAEEEGRDPPLRAGFDAQYGKRGEREDGAGAGPDLERHQIVAKPAQQPKVSVRGNRADRSENLSSGDDSQKSQPDQGLFQQPAGGEIDIVRRDQLVQAC